MQNMTLGKVDNLIVHFIGNKNNGDGVRFSDTLANFGEIERHINQLVLNSFKSEDFYQFYFTPNLELNPIYQFVSSIFEIKETFIEQSRNVGRYLYDKSTHPQIKGGEFCIVYFRDCRIKDEVVDCIGFFKSESKETILKVCSSEKGFDLKEEKGINTNKLEKGCLIFNLEKESGFLISVVDNINKNIEAQYWKDDFLGIRPIKNEFNQTNQFLGITKQFLTKHLAQDLEVSKADQIDLLNRSVEYFKTHDFFKKENFEKEVLQDTGIIDSFRIFDNTYRKENEIELSDNFSISPQAVKKQAKIFKNVLKLDKNFHIHIYGDRDLIERGVENDGRKYYKIYYQDES